MTIVSWCDISVSVIFFFYLWLNRCLTWNDIAWIASRLKCIQMWLSMVELRCLKLCHIFLFLLHVFMSDTYEPFNTPCKSHCLHEWILLHSVVCTKILVTQLQSFNDNLFEQTFSLKKPHYNFDCLICSIFLGFLLLNCCQRNMKWCVGKKDHWHIMNLQSKFQSNYCSKCQIFLFAIS